MAHTSGAAHADAVHAPHDRDSRGEVVHASARLTQAFRPALSTRQLWGFKLFQGTFGPNVNIRASWKGLNSLPDATGLKGVLGVRPPRVRHGFL